MKLKQKSLCVPKGTLQDYFIASHLGNFSNRETGVWLHAEFHSASPFSLVV